jgi:F-type H+-transporting ATPase subunit gamma
VSRERSLRQRLQALGTLHEAVGALRSLSAHHFRAARAALPAARAYRAELERTMGVLGTMLPEPVRDDHPTAVVLVAADLGLCGDYVSRLSAEAAAARAELGPGPLWCVGRRAARPLARAGLTADRIWNGATGTLALPRLLVPLVNAIVGARADGHIGSLTIVAARFEGAGHFRPVRVRLLPVRPPPGAAPLRPSPYTSPAHLTAVVVREFLYVALYETFLEALAAEHGKRLVVTESARNWLQERRQATVRQLGAQRRETATEEVLEVAAGARALRRTPEVR